MGFVSFLLTVCLYFEGPKKGNTPASQHSFRRPLSQLNSPVFVSDSEDDEDNIVIRSSWKVRHSKPVPKVENHHREEENLSPSPPLPPSPLFSHPPSKASASILSPKRTFSAPSRLDESSSSEEEFVSLLERLKKKNIVGGTSFTPKTSKGFYSSFYVVFLSSEGFFSSSLFVVLTSRIKQRASSFHSTCSTIIYLQNLKEKTSACQDSCKNPISETHCESDGAQTRSCQQVLAISQTHSCFNIISHFT